MSAPMGLICLSVSSTDFGVLHATLACDRGDIRHSCCGRADGPHIAGVGPLFAHIDRKLGGGEVPPFFPICRTFVDVTQLLVS